MDLRWPLLSLALAALLPVLFWLVGLFRAPEQEPSRGLPVGAVERIRALPRFKELARQQASLARLEVLCAVVLLLGVVWLVGRPSGTTTNDPEALPGDLVLCLDLTPANRETDIEVLARARQVLDSLGEGRVALRGFQDTTAELLPLTDDAGAAADIFTETSDALRQLGGGASGPGAIGDGLISCADSFDKPAEQRGRAVLLVTAGGSATSSLHTLAEGTRYAEKHGVAVYTVLAGATGPARADLTTTAETTGGRVVPPTGVARVLEFERERLDPPSVQVREDRPLLPTGLVLLGAGGLVALGVRGMFR